MKTVYKIAVLLSGVGLFQSCTFQQTEDKKPEYTDLDSIKITEHIPAGYEILCLVKGNLNFDKLDDIIVVLNSVDERNIRENPPYRPLLIFWRTPNNTYEKVVENNQAILTHDMAGTSVVDPLHSIKIDSGTFKISHVGGFGHFRWEKAATFGFSKGTQSFNLLKEETIKTHIQDTLITKDEEVLNKEHFGNLIFEEYNILEGFK